MQRKITAVEHVSGKKIWPARGAPLFCFLNEWQDKFVELVLKAMVRVQRNVNRITRGYAMNVFGDRNRAERRVFERRARRERAAAGGNLNDSVGLGLRESAEGGIGGSQRGDVDRG